jgi:hypothetical protein
MEHLTAPNILFGILGIITVFLLRLDKLRKKKEPFVLLYWVRKNWTEFMLGLIGTFIGIYFADWTMLVLDTKKEALGPNFYQAHAYISGMCGQFLISKLFSWART